ncbi:MAG: CpsD/CapB family tyrosine-protein kinase, partial [Candidatus Omnitrophota bacterium]
INTLKGEMKISSIMITSAVEENGKSVTCCNLASTIASDPNKRVALIDCDIRKPSIHTLFNTKRAPGITDILEGRSKLSDLIKSPSAGNLFLIPAGTETQHPSDLLRGQALRDLLETLKSSFDYVIIDTPPTLPVTDSRIIGHLCDAIILVIRFDKTSKKNIKDSFSLLKIAHSTPIACILTDFHAPIYNYTRYSRYYHGGLTEKKK